MIIAPLDTPQANASYDSQTGLVHIAYRGELGADVTHAVYDWLNELYAAIGVNPVCGQIFDFRKVTVFLDDNLQAARRASKFINIRMDTSRIPVALLVSEFFQEEILLFGMRITPDHARKRIVWSEQDALNFIIGWRETHLMTEE